MKKFGKEEVYSFLNSKGIPFEVKEHAAVYTVEEANALNLPHPEAATKNLFLKDKKHKYFLLVVREDVPVNLKELRTSLESAPLHFASAEELLDILGLIPGSVSPLGVLNDEECCVEVVIESGLKGKLVAMHPNENTATIWLCEPELSNIVTQHGNSLKFIEI